MCMNEMYNSNNSIYIVRSLSLSSILQSLNKTHKFSSRSLTNLSCVQQTKLSNTCLTTDDFDANYNRENISMSNCKQTNAREMDLFNDKTEANNGCELSTNSSSNPTTYYHVGSGNDRNVSTVDEVPFQPNSIHDTSSSITFDADRQFYCREWLWEKLLKHLVDDCESNTRQNCKEVCINKETHKELAGRLVICGESGSGKTSICRKLVQTKRNVAKKLKAKRNCIQTSTICEYVATRLLAYHFCDARSKTSLQPEHFVRSLHDQLVSDENPFSNCFKEAFGKGSGDYNQSSDVYSSSDAFYYDIIEPLRRINISHFSKHPENNPLSGIPDTYNLRFFILIDGVDEIYNILAKFRSMDDKALFVNTNSESENNRVPNGSILEMLANHSHLLPDWLLLIVTCRRKYRSIIKHMFPGIKTIAIDDLRKPMIAQDIQEYMTCRFNEESIQCSNEVRLEMMHLLRIKSSACMLYLETVLDLIRDGRINLQDVAFIPGTLNGLFLWLCQHLFPLTSEFDSESTFVSVKPLLNIMLASCEPLSVQSLYSVLLVSKPDLAKSTFYQQLHQLKPIISLNYESSDYIINKTNTSGFMDSLIVHFLHEVFAEWLIDVKHCTSTYLCNITDGQFLIEKALVNNTKYDSSYISRNKDNDSYDRNLLLLSSEEYPGLIVRKSNDNDVTLDLCKASMLIKKSKSADQTDSRYMANTLDCTTLSSDPNVVPDSNHVIYPQTSQLSDVDHNRIGYDYSTYSMKERDEEYGTAEQLRQKTSICHELISAIRLGQYENIKLLLESDADPNTIDQDGWSALRTAAWGGYSDIVQLLIYYGADVNLSGPDGRTALRAAAWAGNVGTVKCLLNAGADVNKSDSEKRTALIAAAYMGHKDVLEVLLEAGADVNHSDSDGRTALHVAAFCVQKSDAHADIVASLLNHGANPNLSDSEGITPLLGASNTGNCVVCELCLEADADVNITDKSGRTPVMLAVLGGYTHIVRLLLFWGATVDIMDYAGRSLLSIAAQIKNAQIVQELLARGLDEAHKDHSGCTPLHLTLENSCDSELSLEHENNQDECCEEVIRLLLDAGASLEETDNAGRTSLLVACQANNINAVHILLNYSTNDPLSCRSPTHSGSSESRQQLNPNSSHGHLPHYVHPCINIASYDGQTPLRAAAFNGNQDMVKLLLSYGADPDHQDAYGRTTLYMLALEGQLDMADLLLHCPAPGVLPRPGSSRLIGANPVLSDDEGRFPLHVVTWLGHVDFVRLLLQAGTPVDIRDREGRTPLQLAAWQGHAEICHILLNEGNARVDAVCSQGATALCIAAQEGHLDVCKVLLQANANPLQTDSHGRTPYRVALKAGHLEICKLLELSQPDFTMINGQWQSINNDPFQNKHVKDMKTRRDSDKVPQFPVSSQQKYAVNNTPIVSDSPAKINSKEFQVVRTENLNQNISPRQHNQPSKVYYDDDNPYARPPELFTTRFVPTKKSVTHCGQPSQTSISHGSHHIVEDMKTVHNQNCIPKSGYYIPLEQKNHTHENWWNTPVCYQSQPTSTETNHTPISCNLNSGYPLHMIIPSEGVHIHSKFDQNHLPGANFIRYNQVMLPATGYCGEDRYPVSNQIPQHTSVIIPTNRNHEVPLIKSGASGEQVSKHLIWENTQPNDNKLNSPAQNATSPSGQPTQFKHTQNSNKEASLKHRKLISSRLECFGGPSSSKSRQIPQHQSIPNANDGFYPDDVKGMFFKSAVAGVFGLGSKKHKKSPKASSGKHGSPVLGSNVP